jgi:mannose/fructose-specific phosphotransferase system component IIA
MTRGLIVTHGRIGEALLAAVESFLGRQPYLGCLSNEGLATDALVAEIDSVRRDGSSPLVVFADMPGGSCETAARSVARHADVVAITGVNLPMLVEFCHYRGRLEARELVKRVVAKGGASISMFGEGGDGCPS